MADSDIVTFLDPDGNEISNDPRWLAKQEVLKFEDTVSEPEVTVTSQGVEAKGYDGMDAAQLKAEVKTRREAGREIDTTGVKKKAQLVKLLEADDEAKEEEDLADLSTNPNGTPGADSDEGQAAQEAADKAADNE